MKNIPIFVRTLVGIALLCGIDCSSNNAAANDLVAQGEIQSSLYQYLLREGYEIDKIPLGDLFQIFRTYRSSFVGELSEFDKFSRVSEFCSIIAEHPDRRSVVPDLVTALGGIPPLNVRQDQAKNWNEIAVTGRGGAFGEIVSCIYKIEGFEGIGKALDSLAEAGDTRRIEGVLKRFTGCDGGGGSDDANEFLLTWAEGQAAEETKELVTNFVEGTGEPPADEGRSQPPASIAPTPQGAESEDAEPEASNQAARSVVLVVGGLLVGGAATFMVMRRSMRAMK